MSGRERRTSPRKECVVPLRFRVLTNGHGAQAEEIAASYGMRESKLLARAATLEGEALNISERGVYFTSREKLQVGEPLEMYFTLPRELTGRGPELVRCSARVVHVDEETDRRGVRGIGATVERFEPVVVGAQLGELKESVPERLLASLRARLNGECGFRRGRVVEIVCDLHGESMFAGRKSGKLHESSFPSANRKAPQWGNISCQSPASMLYSARAIELDAAIASNDAFVFSRPDPARRFSIRGGVLPTIQRSLSRAPHSD